MPEKPYEMTCFSLGENIYLITAGSGFSGGEDTKEGDNQLEKYYSGQGG